MSYWAYENWRANGHQARIHRGDCGHCNEVSGQKGGTRSDNGRWIGPFSTAEEAEAAALQAGVTAPRRCNSCAP